MTEVKSNRIPDHRSCRFRRINQRGVRLALEVTRCCSFRCAHCFVPRDNQTPSLASLAPILERLNEICCKKVILTGGEPLLRSDLEDIVRVCAEQGILVDLNSTLYVADAARGERTVNCTLTSDATTGGVEG